MEEERDAAELSRVNQPSEAYELMSEHAETECRLASLEGLPSDRAAHTIAAAIYEVGSEIVAAIDRNGNP
jgi:hypothetical protein